MFVRIIKIFKIIDQSSLLLELISDPIKSYLRKRKDTMRCLIGLIMNSDESSINFETNPVNNKKNDIKFPNLNKMFNINENLSSDEDEEECEKWQPFPIEVTKHQLIKDEIPSDIISTLVYIFGSPEDFVEHYKKLLAERSLTDPFEKFNIKKEVKNLELLKIKFGENNFLSCDVLIKDIKDTIKINKIINNVNDKYIQDKLDQIIPSSFNSNPFSIVDLNYNININKKKENKFDNNDNCNLNVLIISNNFWNIKNNLVFEYNSNEQNNKFCKFGNLSNEKQIRNNEVNNIYKSFFEKINNKFNEFNIKFSKNKSSRFLEYYSNLGFVDIDLIFENITANFRVTPLSALIIQLFDDNLIYEEKRRNFKHINKLENYPNSSIILIEDYKFLKIDFISDLLNSSVVEIKKKINFWVSKGVLSEFYDEKEENEIFYAPNETLEYSPINNYEKENNLIIEDGIFNFDFTSTNQNKLNLENAILTLLKNSGPKNFEQILKKLNFSFKVNINEIKMKEILGKMTLEQKIFKEGEFFNIL